jgi:hypothetical protein
MSGRKIGYLFNSKTEEVIDILRKSLDLLWKKE